MGRRLSPLDTAFLLMETPTSPVQVGGILIVEPEMDPIEWVDRLWEDWRSVVPRPPFSQKVDYPRLPVNFPRWVEDNDLDMDYHVRRSALPHPGNMAQLLDLIARLHGTRLDPTKPLWESYIIEGVEGGRVALYTKVHHAMLDGLAGMSFLEAMLDDTPEAPEMSPPRAPWAPPARKHKRRPHAGLVRRWMSRGQGAIKTARGTVAGAADLTTQTLASLGIGKAEVFPAPFEAPKSPLNVKIGGARRIAVVSLSLAKARAIGKAVDGTVNDAILAVTAGALRRFLIARNQLPAKPLIASMPVAVKPGGNAAPSAPDAGNHIAYILASLGTDIVDPIARLRRIREAADGAKHHVGELKAETATALAMLGNTLTVVLKQTGTLDVLPPPANLIISNVPGPKDLRWLRGARMVANYPLSVLVDGQAMNITIASYADQLDYGVLGDRKAFPDLDDISAYFKEAEDELWTAITQAAA